MRSPVVACSIFIDIFLWVQKTLVKKKKSNNSWSWADSILNTMQANYLHHQGGRLGVLLHRRQTFVTSNPSCDLKQGKYLADLQPSSGSDSSVAAGRIRRINRKKSVALKASVCVWYWLGHAPVDLHPHVLRNFSWGLPRGFCTSALISFAFVAEGE